MERYHVVERSLAEREAAQAEMERRIGSCTDELAATAQPSSEREERLAVLENEISAIHSSATWRWTQSVLRSWPAQRLLGPLIRAVAERAQRNEASSL